MKRLERRDDGVACKLAELWLFRDPNTLASNEWNTLQPRWRVAAKAFEGLSFADRVGEVSLPKHHTLQLFGHTGASCDLSL
jgi:hypothetical protein